MNLEAYHDERQILDRQLKKRSLSQRLRQYSSPKRKKPQSSTYYVFIAQGLGVWLAKELVSRASDPEFCQRVVGLFFVPPQLADSSSTSAKEHLQLYLDGINRVFNEGFDGQEWVSPITTTISDLEQTDTSPTGLKNLLGQSTKLARQELKLGSGSNNDGVLEARRASPLALAIANKPPVSDQSGRTSRSSAHSRSQSLSSLGSISCSSGKARLFRSVKEAAVKALDDGHLEHARDLYARCSEMLQRTHSPGWEYSRLEVELEFSVVKIYLGHYHEALHSLKEVLAGIRQFKHQPEAKTTVSDTPDLSKLANYRFATLLLRIAAFDDAQEILLEHFDKAIDFVSIRNNTKLPAEYRRSDLWLATSVSQLRAQLEAIRGGFDSAAKYLRDADEAYSCLEAFRRGPELKAKDLCQVRLETTGLSISVTKAKIMILTGDLKEALALVRGAVKRLKHLLGSQNALTMEAAVLESLLIAVTSGAGSRGGEDLAAETKAAVSARFGPSHPLTLEAAYSLVTAFRAQGKFKEARQQSRHLCWEADSCAALTAGLDSSHNHPSLLKYHAQRAVLEFSMGNYKDSEDIMSGVYDKSAAKWPGMAFTSMYLAECARIRIHLGNRDKARKHLVEVIKQQLPIYAPSVTFPGSLRDRPFIQKLLETGCSAEKPKVILHPILLFTLYVVCELELEEEDSDLEFVRDLASRLVEICKTKFGHGHEWTIMAILALAKVYSRLAKLDIDNVEHLKQALKFFVFAARAPSRNTHPLALHAWQQAVEISLLLMEPSSAEKTKQMFLEASDQLKRIADLQERHLETNHPDRQKTLVSLLRVKLALGPSDTLRSSNALETELLNGLQDPKVRRQRYFESLNLEDEVAEIFRHHGMLEESAKVSEEMKKSLRSVLDYGGQINLEDDTRTRMERRIDQRLRGLRERTKQVSMPSSWSPLVLTQTEA